MKQTLITDGQTLKGAHHEYSDVSIPIGGASVSQSFTGCPHCGVNYNETTFDGSCRERTHFCQSFELKRHVSELRADLSALYHYSACPITDCDRCRADHERVTAIRTRYAHEFPSLDVPSTDPRTGLRFPL